MTQRSLPWWRTDTYDGEDNIPHGFMQLAGPNGLALVKAWDNGKTSTGWGHGDFMASYQKNLLHMKPALIGFSKGLNHFAFVMRSLRVVCIDIDGKNGGLEHAKKLGQLPPTVAETSKSGTDYHLFYSTDEDWDSQEGYALVRDRIGIVTGVDIRGTGCVYHHKQQRWNSHDIAPLPEHLKDRLLGDQRLKTARAGAIATVMNNNDELEIMMMQEELVARLAKDIPEGKRNNTLFAIGQDMKKAGMVEWPQFISDRASELGLDGEEITRLVRNIENYN